VQVSVVRAISAKNCLLITRRDMENCRIIELDKERAEVSKKIAALQRERADLSIKITHEWQNDARSSVPQPESESLTGSVQPD